LSGSSCGSSRRSSSTTSNYPPELCVDTPTNKIIIPISEKRDSNSRTSLV
jgi:hypothetical protein